VIRSWAKDSPYCGSATQGRAFATAYTILKDLSTNVANIHNGFRFDRTAILADATLDWVAHTFKERKPDLSKNSHRIFFVAPMYSMNNVSSETGS
jgi:hypothetical protein